MLGSATSEEMCTVLVTVTFGAADELTWACTLKTSPDTFAVSDGIKQVTDPVERVRDK